MQRLTQYCATIDKFLSPYGSFTCEEMDDVDLLENEWKDSLPKYHFTELMKIFPEAKSVTKKILQDEIKKCKDDLAIAEKIELDGKNFIQWNSRERNQWYWLDVLDALLVKPFRDGREQTIRRNQFYINSMKKRKEGVKTSGVSPEQIYFAKKVPISTFLKVSHDKALCLFHNDSDPSMHIYEKDNRYYCFVCNANGDVIDLVMALRNISFIDAVKSLI